jgi:hypothetical protein
MLLFDTDTAPGFAVLFGALPRHHADAHSSKRSGTPGSATSLSQLGGSVRRRFCHSAGLGSATLRFVTAKVLRFNQVAYWIGGTWLLAVRRADGASLPLRALALVLFGSATSALSQ